MCDIGKHISLRTLHHLIRDYQGSVNVVTDQGGAVVAEYSYDPWGRQRDPVTLAPYATDEEPELMFGRGYTGHEHLPEYGLIHMNARFCTIRRPAGSSPPTLTCKTRRTRRATTAMRMR